MNLGDITDSSNMQAVKNGEHLMPSAVSEGMTLPMALRAKHTAGDAAIAEEEYLA